MKLFDEIGTEEVVIPTEDTTVNTMVIGDVLASEAATADMEECAREIADLEMAIESGVATMATVEAQIDVESALLAKPESIAASTVALSYESMKITAAILGADVDALEISQEAMEKSPATALEISVEEKQSFVKNIVEKIKKALAVIWKKIKAFAQKAMLVFASLEKKSIALLTEVNVLKGDGPKELSEALVKKIKARNAGHYMLGGTVLETLLASNGAPVKVSGFYNRVNNAIQAAEKAIGDDDSANGKAVAALFSAVKDALKDTNLDSKLNSDENKAVFTLDGSVFSAIAFKAPEAKDTYTKEAALAAVNSLDITVSNVETKDAKFDVKAVNAKELQAMASDLVKQAKKVKDYSKAIDALTSSIDKNTAGLKGDKVTDKASAKIGQLLGTGVSGKLISGHLANVKNTMLLINDLKNTFGSDKKEESKKEESKKEEPKKEDDK